MRSTILSIVIVSLAVGTAVLAEARGPISTTLASQHAQAFLVSLGMPTQKPPQCVFWGEGAGDLISYLCNAVVYPENVPTTSRN